MANSSAIPYPIDNRVPFSRHDALFAIAMFLLPFSLDAESVVVSYSFPVFVLLAVYYIGALMREGAPINWRLTGIFAMSSLSVVIMFVTSLLGENPIKSLSRVAIHVNGLLILWYFCSKASGSELDIGLSRYHRLMKILVRSGAIMAFYYMFNLVYQAREYGVERVLIERWTGGIASLPWGASNTVAGALLIPLVGCLQILAEPKSDKASRRVLRFGATQGEWVGYALIIVGGILSTLSRNAIAVMLVLLALFILRKATTAVLMAACALCVLVIFSADWDFAFSIFEQRFTGEEIETLNDRLAIWDEYWDYISANPFSPIGYYNTLLVFGHSAHNFSLTTYAEQSALGWLVAASLFVMLLKKARQLSLSPAREDLVHGRFFLLGLVAIAANLHVEDANFTHQYILYWYVFISLLCYRFSIMIARPSMGSSTSASH